MGKLKIYIAPADKIRLGNRSMFRKFFPKSAYIHILEDARSEGILNASVYNTHSGFSHANKKVRSFNIDGDNSKLAMCVELVDSRERLAHFFKRHQDHLEGKVVIYKEVESWNI